MKKLCIIISIICMLAVLFFGTMYKDVNKEYLRIHIRANSNLDADQNVKYKVKDAVVEQLTPYVASCNCFDEVKNVIKENLLKIDNIANQVLKNNGFNYTAKSKLTEEEFPTRDYNGFVLESGYYDAIIIELGEAKGDNWWCVVYPPLCFVDAGNGSNVVYRSRIIDLINNFKK